MIRLNQKLPNPVLRKESPAANDNALFLEQNSNDNNAPLDRVRSWQRRCLACRREFAAFSPHIRVCPGCKGLCDRQENFGDFEFHEPEREDEDEDN
jgi:hypothetical protein